MLEPFLLITLLDASVITLDLLQTQLKVINLI